MPRKVFTAGEILTAADVNTNLMDQAVMVFDDSAARGSAIPTPSEGMVTYLKDTDAVEKYDGSSFVAVGIAPAILQVVSNTHDTQADTTSTSFQSSGLTATITPQSTANKVLVLVHTNGANVNNSGKCIVTVFRGTTAGTNLAGAADHFGAVYSASGQSHSLVHANFLDSPSTTSAQTYTLAFRTDGGEAYVQIGNTRAVMTLMEVAA